MVSRKKKPSIDIHALGTSNFIFTTGSNRIKTYEKAKISCLSFSPKQLCFYLMFSKKLNQQSFANRNVAREIGQLKPIYNRFTNRFPFSWLRVIPPRNEEV